MIDGKGVGFRDFPGAKVGVVVVGVGLGLENRETGVEVGGEVGWAVGSDVGKELEGWVVGIGSDAASCAGGLESFDPFPAESLAVR